MATLRYAPHLGSSEPSGVRKVAEALDGVYERTLDEQDSDLAPLFETSRALPIARHRAHPTRHRRAAKAGSGRDRRRRTLADWSGRSCDGLWVEFAGRRTPVPRAQ